MKMQLKTPLTVTPYRAHDANVKDADGIVLMTASREKARAVEVACNSFDGLVSAVQSAKAAGEAIATGKEVHINLLVAEMVAALAAAGVPA